MHESLHNAATNYAQMVLEWLDTDARAHHVKRSDLVELFIDTLRALEQYRSQED